MKSLCNNPLWTTQFTFTEIDAIWYTIMKFYKAATGSE